MILASASGSRLQILRGAGLEPLVDPAAVDEAEVKAAMRADGAAAEDVVEALAELKARQTSRRHPGGLVVGADQMLVCDGEWFDKPPDLARARAQLLALRGRTHRLVTCAVVVRDGARLWHHLEDAALSVRAFSDAFLDAYLTRCGERVLTSVGAYQLEGPGAQLFERVNGDHFVILGLPLLPLLAFLRGHGVVLA